MIATLGRDADSAPPTVTSSPSPSGRLRTQFAAARVSFTWLGVRKALSPEQREQAAERFGATGAFLSAGKKLLDTRHPRFRAVTAVRGRAQSYWRGVSLPYPEPGLRLIRQDAIGAFDRQLAAFKAELDEAVADLDAEYDALRSAARDRLGTLFDPADYPPSLRGLFDVAWEFPRSSPRSTCSVCRRRSTRRSGSGSRPSSTRPSSWPSRRSRPSSPRSSRTWSSG